MAGLSLLHHRAWPPGETELWEFDCAYPMPLLGSGLWALGRVLGYREEQRHSPCSRSEKTQSEMWETRSWLGVPAPDTRPRPGL